MTYPEYVDNRGVGYNILQCSDGSWAVWELVNRKTGWTWKGTLCSYDLAMSFMGWIGDFKEIENVPSA